MDQKVEEYRAAVRACVITVALLKQHDLPALLKAIDTADAVGPFLDPTLWRDKHEKMTEDRELLEAALPLWRMAEKLQQHPAPEHEGS